MLSASKPMTSTNMPVYETDWMTNDMAREEHRGGGQGRDDGGSLGSDVERFGHRRIRPGDRGARADLEGRRHETPIIIEQDDVARSPEQDMGIEHLARNPVGIPRYRTGADRRRVARTFAGQGRRSTGW